MRCLIYTCYHDCEKCDNLKLIEHCKNECKLELPCADCCEEFCPLCNIVKKEFAEEEENEKKERRGEMTREELKIKIADVIADNVFVKYGKTSFTTSEEIIALLLEAGWKAPR